MTSHRTEPAFSTQAPEQGAVETPLADLLASAREEIRRLDRCITMAMGCLDPNSDNVDERLAWFRLFDATAGGGKEPRNVEDLPPRDFLTRSDSDGRSP